MCRERIQNKKLDRHIATVPKGGRAGRQEFQFSSFSGCNIFSKTIVFLLQLYMTPVMEYAVDMHFCTYALQRKVVGGEQIDNHFQIIKSIKRAPAYLVYISHLPILKRSR